MLKEVKNLLSFLTIIPLSMDKDCLTDAAKVMFLFPLVGAFIGLLAGLFDWVTSQFLPSLVVGALVLGLLLLITGLHHTDGLLDFGDGIMAQGSAERKIEIMHDQLTGAGGLSLGIMTFLITALSIAELRTDIIIQGLIVVEISAKLSMVIGAWAGKAVHKGMSSSFIEAMHGKKGTARLIAALVISFGIAVPLLWLAGVVTLLAAIMVSLIMVGISHRHFKGVTGDVLGATNELTRMFSLITLLALIRWV
ncbi:MAG: adenosylcobinamide-GDP ribazoletransferase [Candidatus Bathyarchaeota archaeon]|nr:MAG: adenosylcobinamide-GDP ribazoletransferase [Candidatus Bathyarchaeota archaeon]